MTGAKVDYQVAAPTELGTPTMHRTKIAQQRVRMEGWRQRRPGSNARNPQEGKRKQKEENTLDSYRPSHGRSSPIVENKGNTRCLLRFSKRMPSTEYLLNPGSKKHLRWIRAILLIKVETGRRWTGRTAVSSPSSLVTNCQTGCSSRSETWRDSIDLVSRMLIASGAHTPNDCMHNS